jgi:hypothetical protein
VLAETEWSLAQLSHHTFDYPATVHHSQQTLALARELENRELIAVSLNTLAYQANLSRCRPLPTPGQLGANGLLHHADH